MNRAEWNYRVDVLTGTAFVFSAVSGLVFLLPGNGAASILGLSYRVWDGLHIWSSLAMIAGVGAHLLLHARWIGSMTRRTLACARRVARGRAAAEPSKTEGVIA
jgi:hypothetical protein